MKTKILIVCNMGRIRSRYLAGYLKEKGYSTKFGGVSRSAVTRITPKKLKWADKIVIVSKNVKKKFYDRYNVPEVEIININVSDSTRDYPKKYRKEIGVARKRFLENHVYPNLRNKIDKKLK